MKPGYRCDHIGGHDTVDRSRLQCEMTICNDGRKHDGHYCGKGPCNAFGCNCDGGCWNGDSPYPLDPQRNFMDNYGEFVTRVRLFKKY